MGGASRLNLRAQRCFLVAALVGKVTGAVLDLMLEDPRCGLILRQMEEAFESQLQWLCSLPRLVWMQLARFLDSKWLLAVLLVFFWYMRGESD